MTGGNQLLSMEMEILYSRKDGTRVSLNVGVHCILFGTESLSSQEYSLDN